MELFNDTTSFAIAQKPACKCIFDEKRVSTAAKPKTALKRTEGEETDELFGTDFVPEDSQASVVESLIEKHCGILSRSRRSSKVFERVFLEIEQIVRGEFLYAYTWDKSWWTRISSKYPLEQVVFKDQETLLRRLDDVLEYVEERQPYGYWWPSRRNASGKVSRKSLADFIASQTKSGSWWSPFLEIACGDCATPRMYRDSLGPKVCKILDRILERAWFGKDYSTMVKFYRSVSDLKNWYEKNLKERGGYYLSSFESFLEEIDHCDEETQCVGLSFIGPWSPKWETLKSWMKKVRGVVIE